MKKGDLPFQAFFDLAKLTTSIAEEDKYKLSVHKMVQGALSQ